MGRKFTILSLVGGGIRGLMSATILQRLYFCNVAQDHQESPVFTSRVTSRL